MIRKAAISWRNLVHDLARTGLALAGIGFALVVIFMQLGFSQAVERTATLVLGKLDFDILIVSRSYVFLAAPGVFPMARIRTAESVPGVVRVVPLHVRPGLWHNLSNEHPAEGLDWLLGWLPRRHSESKQEASEAPWKERAILVLAWNPTDRIFAGGIPGRDRGPADLEAPGALLIDRRSRKEFGPQKKDTQVELNKQEFHIAGDFEMGTGFAIDGAALLNHHNFARAYGGDALDFPTLGLVKIADARDTVNVVERLRKALPIADSAGGSGADVRVLSRDEILGNETRYWVSERSIGILFKMGVIISFIVGFVVFYQVFSSDIADHLSEYATLKAIGYSNGQVGSIVVSQALLLGMVGYAVALVVAWGIYWLVETMTRMPMSLWDAQILAEPLALGLVISCGSALFSIRKVCAANPADLFR
jgi:putative ABC transport system permease protein